MLSPEPLVTAVFPVGLTHPLFRTGVGVNVEVIVEVAISVAVDVKLGVWEALGVHEGVLVVTGVSDGVLVGVKVAVAVFVDVGVGVEPAVTFPPPKSSKSAFVALANQSPMYPPSS